MKTLIFVITLILFSGNISTQWIFKQTNAGISTQPYNTQFLNPSTGYVLYKSQEYTNSPINWRIMKTTNKGTNWSQKTETYRVDPLSYADISFLNVNTGFLCVKDATYGTTTYYTSNGGNNWVGQSYWGLAMGYPQIKFIDENTGYLFSRGDGNLYKTINKGYSWVVKYSFTQGGIWDLAISPNNSNRIYIGGHRIEPGQFYNSNPYLVKSEDGFNTSTIIIDGNSSNGGMFSILKIFIDNVNGNEEVRLGAYKSLKKLLNNTGDLQTIYDYPQGMNGWQNFKIAFSDNKIGYGYWQYEYHNNKIIKTTDGGYNWFTDLSNFQNPYNSELKDFNAIGDMCFLPDWFGIMIQKKLTINFNTMFDWNNSGQGTIFMDNLDNAGIRTFNTSISNQYLAGGSAYISVPDEDIYRNDSTLKFYYWGGDNGNASMTPEANQFYYIKDGSINADYKTKLQSNTEKAITNANQIKSLKDTNGVTNLIYESMGGIFFTRTLHPNHNTFKAEEVVSGTLGNSGYATFNNANPYLAEFKSYQNTASNHPEKNVWACWERREGNNIKILVAARSVDEVNRPVWYVQEYATIQDTPSDFKCFPKLVVAGNLTYNTRVLTYLKPVSASSRKLVGKIFYNNNLNIQELEIIPQSNIQEYAIAPIANNGFGGSTVFNVHLSYRTIESNNQQPVFYKHVQIGWDQNVNLQYYNEVPNTFAQISNDNARWRASLDISLKNTVNNSSSFNMQPVITYQGKYDVRVMIENEDGPPTELVGSYYPIYVKERLSGGGWNYSISYNSGVNKVQFTPNVEGAKHKNSYLLSYARGSNAPFSYFQKIPLWDGVYLTHGYYCNPDHSDGTDVKFTKGGFIDNGSANQNLMALKTDQFRNGIFDLEKRPFSITNAQQGDGDFDAVNGIIEDNDIKYSFNLGNILVNNSGIGFPIDLDTVINNSTELSSNMASKTFLLNENDTLIIGRNASFMLTDPNGVPVEIEYWVKLMNKSTNSLQRLLVHDTLHTADSVIYEFLEGYIIRNIPNGTDSFYVQLEIDTVDGNFGIGGGIGGDGDGGDNIQFKRKIYWENEKITHETSNIPKSFNLYQNFPNPFNPATVIKYDLPKDVKVTVKIYDLLGREVTTLINNEYKNAGRYEVNWNAGNYASGVYIYRIEAGDYISTKKMVLIK